MRILAIFGTRPEAIKMCPLVLELRKHANIECSICLTGQHRELSDSVMQIFGISADYNLDIMKPSQTLTGITSSVLIGLEHILNSLKPDMVLVHGDTTTSFAAALASFYAKIPVGHVEAGLRSYDVYSPYPEEMNRLITDRLSSIHFAPTENNRQNLYNENITENVYVTGNTVIDSFRYTIRPDHLWEDLKLRNLNLSGKIVLITAHRRENWGTPLIEICKAIENLAHSHPEATFIYPVHPNPIVSNSVYSILDNIANVILLPPINVLDMHNLMSKCYMVMTDSGGLQEEAPHFGIPVLVLRSETERPEAVKAGTVKVIGTAYTDIVRTAEQLFSDAGIYQEMSHSINPYGDGHASERIAEILLEKL